MNEFNDPHNCGGCGNTCPSSAPLCLNGRCVVPACGDAAYADAAPTCGSDEVCCGAQCCKSSEICCHVDRYAPTIGLMLACADPSKSGGTCPVGCRGCSCASPDTPIATARGERAIASLSVGDLVYTVDHGQVVLAPLREIHSTPVSHHHVVRVRFSDGTSLDVSAPHPTADGRHFGDLRSGDDLGGRRVAAVDIVGYEFANTYDILPDSDTGTYFAGGALIGSTLGGSANDAARRDGISSP
ncbi:MAG TPA: Hint domain-containing protein [Polyangiaceae bacterium]|nr:Hint domain-containing protein [Polyangiaceae bacterium]